MLEKGATTLSITTFGITTLTVKGLIAAFSITTLYYYAECRILFIAVLTMIMLNVILLIGVASQSAMCKW